MKNNTGLTRLDIFDSTIPKSATQELQVRNFYSTYEYNPESTWKLQKAVFNHNLISESEYIKSKHLELCVTDFPQDEHTEHTLAYYADENPIGKASYTKYTKSSIVTIGVVFVTPLLQHRGLGTQLRKHLENHIEQEGVDQSYTYIISEAGEKLARRCGYKRDEEEFPELPIYVKSY